MSLQNDIIFVKALRANADLMAQLAAGDVYNTAIAMPDEDLDNAPLPYAIVTFDGLTNDIYRTLRGADLLEVKIKAIDNCEAHPFSLIAT